MERQNPVTAVSDKSALQHSLTTFCVVKAVTHCRLCISDCVSEGVTSYFSAISSYQKKKNTVHVFLKHFHQLQTCRIVFVSITGTVTLESVKIASVKNWVVRNAQGLFGLVWTKLTKLKLSIPIFVNRKIQFKYWNFNVGFFFYDIGCG